MSEAKHTPGPWHWNGIATIWNTTGLTDEVDREVIVAQVVCDYGNGDHVEPIPVREANARLIAAAPDLLAACRLWDEGFADGEQFDEVQLLRWLNDNRRAARAAVQKATEPAA